MSRPFPRPSLLWNTTTAFPGGENLLLNGSYCLLGVAKGIQPCYYKLYYSAAQVTVRERLTTNLKDRKVEVVFLLSRLLLWQDSSEPPLVPFSASSSSWLTVPPSKQGRPCGRSLPLTVGLSGAVPVDEWPPCWLWGRPKGNESEVTIKQGVRSGVLREDHKFRDTSGEGGKVC